MSVDQLAIISRSLSNTNVLAPYLSTPYKENLSPESMRSHTYSIEEKDRQVRLCPARGYPQVAVNARDDVAGVSSARSIIEQVAEFDGELI